MKVKITRQAGPAFAFAFREATVRAAMDRLEFGILPAKGEPGVGIAAGGAAGQALVKKSGDDYDTEWVDLQEGNVTQAEFDTLKQYVLDMSPVATVTAPRVSISDAAPLDAEGLVVDIEPVQAGSGDPSPENVRPITGWTGAKVTRTGKNLLLPQMAQGTSSIVVLGQDDAASFGLSLKAGTYTVSVQSSKAFAFYYRAENGTENVHIGGYNVTSATFTLTEDLTLRLYAYLGVGLSVSDISEPQLELGSTATAYEPYQGGTYHITFPSSAGTVYGGSLDVTNGVLTVDRAMVDLGTLTWNKANTPNNNWRFTATVPAISMNAGNVKANMICSVYKTVTANETYTGVTGVSNNVTVHNIIVCDMTYSDADTFKTAMSGVQLVYELATPVTYTLTPQQIALLRGNNILWADTGDTTLTYRQDVAKLLEALMKPDESDMVASATYAANSFFTIGGTLYKATAAIATGETIQPGVNCIQTTVADQLTAIFAQL